MPRSPARAEVVGSLLRPDVVDDEAIARVVQQQIDIGLDVVSDGELRRTMSMDSFWGAVEGWSPSDEPVEFRDDRGSTISWQAPQIEDRLAKVASPARDEVALLSSVTAHPFKVTFPAASLFALPFTFEPGVNDHAYRDLAEIVAHVIEIEKALVAEAVDAGARYIQFDFPAYPYLVDPAWMRKIESVGWTKERVLELAVASDNEVRADIPDDVTVAMHVCRGNNESRYLCEGPLDSVAEPMFQDLDYDAFLVEWDDRDRMGDFGALRYVRDGGPRIVMGIISSKRAELEQLDDVLARMDQASDHVSWEQLAVSTQCGFASTETGNDLSEDDQWRKLELVSRAAVKLWD